MRLGEAGRGSEKTLWAGGPWSDREVGRMGEVGQGRDAAACCLNLGGELGDMAV